MSGEARVRFEESYAEWLNYDLLRSIRRYNGVSEDIFSSALHSSAFLRELEKGKRKKIDYPRVRHTADLHGVPPWLVFAGHGVNEELKGLFRHTTREYDKFYLNPYEGTFAAVRDLADKVPFDSFKRQQFIELLTALEEEAFHHKAMNAISIENLFKAIRTIDSHDTPDDLTAQIVVSTTQPDLTQVVGLFRMLKDTFIHRGTLCHWTAAWFAIEGPVTKEEDPTLRLLFGRLRAAGMFDNEWIVEVPTSNRTQIHLCSWTKFNLPRRGAVGPNKAKIVDLVQRLLLDEKPVLVMNWTSSLALKQQPEDVSLGKWLSTDFPVCQQVKLDLLLSPETESNNEKSKEKKLGRTLPLLIIGRYLQPGDQLVCKFGRCKRYFVDGDRYFLGKLVLTPEPMVRWDYDNQLYAISTLTRKMLLELGAINSESGTKVDGNECWGRLGDDYSLFDVHKQMFTAK